MFKILPYLLIFGSFLGFLGAFLSFVYLVPYDYQGNIVNLGIMSEMIFTACGILSIFFWYSGTFESWSNFAEFWFYTENPPEPEISHTLSYYLVFGLITVSAVVITILVGWLILINIQNHLPNLFLNKYVPNLSKS